MSRADQATERAAYVEKYFRCAETPIQEWLATYVKKTPIDLFPDYKDEVDVIGFMHDDIHYSAYLVAMPWDTELLVNPELLKASDKVKKACSMLYDSVKEVFMAVTGSFEASNKDSPHADLLKSLMPTFDEQKMAFHLTRVNWKALQLKTAYMQRQKIQDFIRETPSEDVPPDQLSAIQNSIEQIGRVFADITKEVLDEYEELCKETNSNIKLYDWLHLAVEQSDPNVVENLNNSMDRLPTFGLQYQDPDEEDYVDRLKREHNVN